MLLLHGLSSNARFWERTAAALPGWHLVALDQRSHGLSDRPLEGNHNPTFVADKAGTYVAQLIVNDGTIDSLPSTVTISDTPGVPAANAGPGEAIRGRAPG